MRRTCVLLRATPALLIGLSLGAANAVAQDLSAGSGADAGAAAAEADPASEGGAVDIPPEPDPAPETEEPSAGAPLPPDEAAPPVERSAPEPPSDPDNPGQADFDRALEIKLTADDLKDLNEVVDLIDSALDEGLDADNADFAEQVLAATLMQRATSLSRVVLGRPVADPRSDPRWLQLRQFALTDLQRVVALDETQSEAWMLIGRLQSLPLGSKSEARRALTKVIRAAEEGADNPAATQVEAETLAQAHALRGATQKEADERLADFSRAVELQPEKAEYLLLRARVHQAEKRPEECLADIERAIAIAPDNPAVHELKALALLMQEKPEAALESFNRATELAPQAIAPYQYRGEVYSKLGQLDEAIEQLDRALEIAPDNLASRLIRAELLMLSEEPERALADIEAALRKQPGLVRAHLMRARALDAMGRGDDAVESLERLADAAPGRVDVQIQLAAYYVEKGAARDAIAVLSRVLNADPDNELALRWRGDMRLLVGEHGEALADFAAAMTLNPLDSGILNNFAWTLATSPFEEIRDGARALELAEKACEVTEYAQPHILSTLAAAHAEAGDFDAAVRWSQEAIEKANELGTLDSYDGQLEAELASYRAGRPWRELQQTESGVDELSADEPPETAEDPDADAEPPPPARSFDF